MAGWRSATWVTALVAALVAVGGLVLGSPPTVPWGRAVVARDRPAGAAEPSGGFRKARTHGRGRVGAPPAGVTARTDRAGAPVSGGRFPAYVADPANYVDPFIGTGSGGPVVGQIDMFPGPSLPFGMVQLSPDTSPDRTDGGGYYYPDRRVLGFSLTHLSGPGCPIAGDFPFLPVAGPPPADPATATAGFSHAGEDASPGYYAVSLGAGSTRIRVQLTATLRSGFAMLSYPPHARTRTILFKTAGSEVTNPQADFHLVSPHEVTGSALSGFFCDRSADYHVYFAAVFNRAVSSYGAWGANGQVVAGLDRSAGPGSGGYVSFSGGSHPAPVLVKLGLSYVSTANALANIRAEDPGWDFGAVRRAARATWNRTLGSVRVAGGTPAERTVFYTALYHAFLDPTTFSDANGQYPGFANVLGVARNTVEVARGRAQYANFSGWDIYRSEVPLISLLDPRQASAMMASLVADGQQGGWLPKWPVANVYSGVMNGDSADPILAGAYAFGARSFDVREALALMLKGADTVVGAPPTANPSYIERPGLAFYLRAHYVPDNLSETLEYATDDFAIGELAQELGQRSVAARFFTRAQNWQDEFNPATGYDQARLGNGTFAPGPAFTPPPPGQFGQSGTQEGNDIQYTWMTPQNLRGEFLAMGGDRAALAKLAVFFRHLNAGPSAPYDWAGNEPSLGSPWVYDYAGAPWQTQAVVRRILVRHYTDTIGGEPGNDDLGAMSSWAVWAMLGLYPETPGSPVLVLGSPIFPRVQLTLPGGRRFVIVGTGAAAGSPYVHSARLDGSPLRTDWLRLAALTRGGELSMVLGPRPDTRWASAPADAPPSLSTGEAPAIGFTLPSGEVDVAPGASAPFLLGVAGVQGRTVVRWHLTSRTVSVTGSSAPLTVRAGGRAEVRLTLHAPVVPGCYLARFTLTARGGSSLPPVVLLVADSPGGSGVSSLCATTASAPVECAVSTVDAEFNTSCPTVPSLPAPAATRQAGAVS